MQQQKINLSKYIVNNSTSLVEVLKRLDTLPNSQTVFITNAEDKVIGTITDGDIRRGLIKGLRIDNPLSDFYFQDFKYLSIGEDNFIKLKEFRELKLKVVPLLDKDGHLLDIYDFTKLKSLLPIDAVIMAGGKGQRLLPLTQSTPKPLLKVGKHEIISYNFKRLFQFGIKNQFVTVNHMAKQVIDFCDNYNLDINFNCIEEPEFLGTAGALSLIDNFENDVILLMNSDLLTNIDYEDLYKTFSEKGADMMVASVPYQVNLPYAIFETDDRIIKSFKEKPNYTYYANSGIYLFKRSVLKHIPKGQAYNATDLMNKVVESGEKLMHYPIRGYWLDIGKHEDYEKAQKDIAHINWD